MREKTEPGDPTLMDIIRGFRRRILVTFFKGYCRRMISLRKGRCRICGCCGRIKTKPRGIELKKGFPYLGIRWEVCEHLDRKTNRCLRWDSLEPLCKWYPIDEFDMHDTDRGLCGFSWEREK